MGYGHFEITILHIKCYFNILEFLGISDEYISFYTEVLMFDTWQRQEWFSYVQMSYSGEAFGRERRVIVEHFICLIRTQIYIFVKRFD